MILKFELLVKVAAVLLVGWCLFRVTAPGRRKRFFPLLLLACIVGTLIGWYTCSLLPNMTEPITITAEGTQNEGASYHQIAVSGFSCDGVELPAVGTTEGLWRTESDGLWWVEQGDSRWIEGMTQSVSFQIPVGWDRYVLVRAGPMPLSQTRLFCGSLRPLRWSCSRTVCCAVRCLPFWLRCARPCPMDVSSL